MSYASSSSILSEVSQTSQELFGNVSGEEYINPHFCRLTRYVHGRQNIVKGNPPQYKNFLVNLVETEALVELSGQPCVDGVYLKVHVPVKHKLLFNRFNNTLEDLRNRLANMSVRYPLCVVGTKNHVGSRLNCIKSLEDRIDGVDYVMLVFVPRGLVSLYKGLWPNQILVELPFEKSAENIRDITRQAIKSFGLTLRVQNVFVMEDDIIAAYKSENNTVVPISMYEFLNELQNTDSEGFPLVGGRSVAVTDTITPASGAWENQSVSGLFLLNTGISTNFQNVTQNDNIDAGLTQFINNANKEGLVQQSQTLVLRRGYTTFDPVEANGNHTLFQRVKYRNVADLEPEQRNIDLRVTVVSNKVVSNKTFPDETKFVKSLGVVGDGSASIVLIGTGDEQVDILKKGAIVDIRGGKIQMFKGYMRLIVDHGVIIPSPDQTDLVPNTSENVSLIEYELV